MAIVTENEYNNGKANVVVCVLVVEDVSVRGWLEKRNKRQ